MASIFRSLLIRLLWLLASLCCALLLWQGLVWGLWQLRSVSFPGPWSVLQRCLILLSGEPWLGRALSGHLLASLSRWGMGYAIGLSIGLLWGILIASFSSIERLTRPWLEVMQLVPGLAWVPIALLIFGVGTSAAVAMIVVVTLPVIAFATVAGIQSIDPQLSASARMLGAGPLTRLHSVTLPGMLAHVLTGLRIAMGSAWRVLVAGEMVVGIPSGLGYAILQSRWTLDFEGALAGVLIIAGLGLLLERGCFTALEALTIRRWGVSHERQ